MESVQGEHRSHATANQRAPKSGETLNNEDDASCGCQPPPCLRNGAKKGVTTVAEIERRAWVQWYGLALSKADLAAAT